VTPPAAEAPVDLTGVTLTDNAGTTWASAVGNGAPMTGPAAFRAGRPGHAPPMAGRGSDDEPPLVALENLGRRPEPPVLETELERQYPADARRDGISGHALYRARVRPDGALDRLRLLDATTPVFAEACRRILAPSRWSPPLDRDGRPDATEIRYVCHFEVSR
jgi:outer membrane biosynthesis protein TonB